MVYLILTRKGYSDLKSEFTDLNKSFWVPAKILSKSEAENYWDMNINLTVMDKEINSENAIEIEEAMHDITEHHPGETVWLEKKNVL